MAWHPLHDDNLVILTSDARLSLYNVVVSPELPEQVCRLAHPNAHPKADSSIPATGLSRPWLSDTHAIGRILAVPLLTHHKLLF
eukprot:69520-Pyramimonas_sp.AAC.2